MEMTDIATIAKQEACLRSAFSCNPEKSLVAKSAASGDLMLRLDLSGWLNYPLDDLLKQQVDGCQRLSLCLCKIGILEQGLCTLLSEVVGPKLVEISFDGCNELTWKLDVKRLFSKSRSVEVINLKNNRWVDDHVLEQLAIRFQKCLRELRIENCSQITNNALFHIGKRCHLLRVLSLDHCSKINDTGILELAKNTQLQSIRIAHNFQVSDRGLEALISAARNLTTLELCNCPKLSDKAVAAVYEAVVSWGRKRNVESHALTRLVLTENPNFTAHMMVLLSASIPGVTALDLQECHNLDLVKGLSELTTFQNIKNLSIGPSRFPFSSHKMLETLLYHAHRLVVLNLCGLPDLLDDHIAELIENSESLDELILQDMNCGTATVEAICSYTPNISKVSIIGSNAITDMDLRCLTTVCISMKELSIQRCNRLSDSAFTRASSFRVLRKLNVAHCSVNCTGALLKYFTLCPLNTLVIDGLTDSPRVVLRFLSPTTLTKLESISIRSSPGLRLADVHYILENFVRCRSIDLTDSLVGSDQVKADTEHFVSPFLSYLNNGRDFCGFRLTSDGFQQYTQFWETKLQLRKHYAARLLQKLRHRYKESMRKLIERRKEVWSVYKIQQAIKIQSLIRMHLARRRLQPILWAGRRIVRGARDYFFYKDYLKLIKAKRYYKIRLVRKSMTAIMISRQRAMTKFSEFSEIVARRRCYWMLRQYFSTLQRLEVIFRDNIFSNKASVIHELAFLRNIVDHWKLLVYGRETMRQRKQKLITIFLACVDLSTHNSTPQKARTEIAIHFNNRNIIIVRWLELCRDLLEIRRVESLVPIATNFYARTFFERVVGSCFLSISDYRDLRVWKKRNKERGSKHHHFFRLKKAFQSISIRVDSCIQQRNLNRQHFLQRGIFMQRLALQDRFLSRTVAIVGFKNLRSTACLHFNNTISKRGLSIMKVNIVAMKQWRVMNRLAEIHRDKLFSLHSMRGWKCFIKFKKNLGDLYAKLYWNRRCSKILRAIAIVVAEKKGKIEQMNTEMHAKFRNEEHFQEVVEKMRSMQRMILVRNAQARFRELRITKLTAIQTLQNFIRTGLALKEFRRRKRLKLLEEKVREDQELDLMRDADGETRFYNYIIKSIIDIQRFVRGCLGRKIAADRLLEKVRERGAEFYEQNDQLRNRFEQFQRAAQAKENARIKCAVLIQKRARGMIGRRIFRDVKYLAEKNKYAVYVQTAYRRRLARLKLDALQRDKVSDLRFRAARKQRGLMLRLVGLRTRHTQQYVAKLLKFLGIDPVTFNYRVSELVRDTINDFDRLRSIYERERDLYREHGLNRINRAQSRRRTLAAEGWRLVVGDAVRVIEEGHRYAGYTGVIIRIDDSLLGVPLYEVKLDRYANRQTFVRMTTDALTVYTSSQPLAKISAKPFLTEFKQPHKIYGLGKEDLFYCKKNVRAAWTIQRAFRMHRARKIARRKRFEFWSRSKAVQWSLINHLADTNTLTEQGGNVTKLLGLHPKKPVHFNELRHSLLPARFASQVRKLNEKVVISKEIEMKYQDRLKYMQKCTILGSKEYFSTGYQKITLGRKLGMLFNMTAGLKMKQNSSLKDVTGARGVRHLVSQRSMVTGVDRFRFKQLHGSPHVRYYKTQLYQGEWSGLPLFTPLRPHGEGVVIFLDGWGFAKENKVLYLTIVRCRYLNVADLFSSDPYCDIFCNNTNLQTTVKWSNLNPEYHESFEIDVTNPNATLNIIVKDKDYIGSDDFLGQIMLDIKEFEDGKEHHETYQLLGEDIKVKEDFDRGEIELRIRWSERVFEDDQVLIENKKRMAIRLQAWARRISALNYLHVMQKDRTAQLAFMKGNAIKITNTCRIRLARKEYRRRMRELK